MRIGTHKKRPEKNWTERNDRIRGKTSSYDSFEKVEAATQPVLNVLHDKKNQKELAALLVVMDGCDDLMQQVRGKTVKEQQNVVIENTIALVLANQGVDYFVGKDVDFIVQKITQTMIKANRSVKEMDGFCEGVVPNKPSRKVLKPILSEDDIERDSIFVFEMLSQPTYRANMDNLRQEVDKLSQLMDPGNETSEAHTARQNDVIKLGINQILHRCSVEAFIYSDRLTMFESISHVLNKQAKLLEQNGDCLELVNFKPQKSSYRN